MAKAKDPWICDKCGRAKGEGNGWLIGFPLAHQECSVMRWAWNDIPMRGYAIIAWDEQIADSSLYPVHHLCSESCALTKQGEYLRP